MTKAYLLASLFIFILQPAQAKFTCEKMFVPKYNEIIEIKYDEIQNIFLKEPLLQGLMREHEKEFSQMTMMIFETLYKTVSRDDVAKSVEGKQQFFGSYLVPDSRKLLVDQAYEAALAQKAEDVLFSLNQQLEFLHFLKSFEIEHNDVLIDSLYRFYLGELHHAKAAIKKETPAHLKKMVSDQVDLMLFELGELSLH